MTSPDWLLAALNPTPMVMAAGFMMFSLLISAQVNPAERPDAAVRGMIRKALHELRRRLVELRGDPVLTRQLIERITLPHLDLTQIARYVLGSYWQCATPGQCDRFRRAFRAHLLQICSRTMEKHAAELEDFVHHARLHYRLVRYDPGRSTAVVRVLALAPKLGLIHLELHLHEHDGPWRIYEITLSGINLMVGLRSELQAQLRSEGLESVIRRLERRTGLLPPVHSPSARGSHDR